MENQPNVKKKSPLNNSKLRLSAPNPQSKGVWSQLSFDIYQNNPRIVVDTREPSLMSKENGFGRITAALDPAVFMMFLEALTEAIAAPGEEKFLVRNSNHGYTNGQRDKEMTPQSDLIVGKDAEGCVYVCVKSVKEGFPVIKFIFGPSDPRYHKFKRGNGVDLTRAEISMMAARAYVRLLSALMPSVMSTHYTEPPPNAYRPGGGGNNNNRGGGGNYGGGGNRPPYNPGGNSAPAAPAASGGLDDDMPF